MTDPNQPISWPLLIRFRKAGLMRFIGHLDWQALQQAMFLKAGLAIKVGEGPTRKLKMKTSPPTPVSVASECELTYVVLKQQLYPEEAERRLSQYCPDGVEIIGVKDASQLATKNPFGVIEAASYGVELGDGLDESQLKGVSSMLERVKSGDPPENIEREEVKQFWGRIIELVINADSVRLMVDQCEGNTFHAAKCATFLESHLKLPHYPRFTKLDYYRLKPSKRRLFR
jgi:radical SAM-linked protein